MQLTIPQRKEIFARLLDSYNPDDLRLMLTLELGQKLESLASTNQAFPLILMELIDKAQGGGWLVDLLKAAAAHKPENNDLNLFVSQFTANLAPEDQPGKAIDPYKACFLRRGNVMRVVTRQEVRGYLQALVEPDGAYRTLVIDGQSASGKTYTQQFISYLASKLDTYRYAYIDLAEDYTPDYTPGDLMESIALTMQVDLNTIPPQEASADRWNQLLYQWLVGQANRSGYSWWIIIDGIRKVTLRKDMEGFIHRTVRDTELTNPHLRLVLLDCGGIHRLPLDVQDNVAYTQLFPLTRDEVKDFFRELWTQQANLFDEGGLDTATDKVLALASQASGDPVSFMRALARAICSVHNKIPEPVR